MPRPSARQPKIARRGAGSFWRMNELPRSHTPPGSLDFESSREARASTSLPLGAEHRAPFRACSEPRSRAELCPVCHIPGRVIRLASLRSLGGSGPIRLPAFPSLAPARGGRRACRSGRPEGPLDGGSQGILRPRVSWLTVEADIRQLSAGDSRRLAIGGFVVRRHPLTRRQTSESRSGPVTALNGAG